MEVQGSVPPPDQIWVAGHGATCPDVPEAKTTQFLSASPYRVLVRVQSHPNGLVNGPTTSLGCQKVSARLIPATPRVEKDTSCSLEPNH